MALIKCPECGQDISDQAAVCPSCGRPNPMYQTNQMYQRQANYVARRYKGYWSTGRLITGIVSVPLSMLLIAMNILVLISTPKPRLQFINIFTIISCIVPIIILIAGFIGICTSNSPKRNCMVAAFLLYIISGLCSPPVNPFLAIRMIILFAFAAVFLVSAIKTKNQQESTAQFK